jgi:hypothetical protein
VSLFGSSATQTLRRPSLGERRGTRRIARQTGRVTGNSGHVTLGVRVKQTPDHALILRVVLLRLTLGEIDAPLAQRKGDLHAFLADGRILGAGRKSATTRSLPIGSSVYLIFVVIDLLAFVPATGAKKQGPAGHPVGPCQSRPAGQEVSRPWS